MTYTLEVYQLNIITQTLTRIDTIQTFQNLSFISSLNGIGSCRFELSVYDPKASKTNLIRFRNHIVVKRNDTIVWGGPITDLTVSYTDVKGSIVVDCNDWLYHLKTRYTGSIKTYTNTDISTIAWNLINTTQSSTNGYLAITDSSTLSGLSRTFTWENMIVSEALTDLSDIVGGIDFSFDYLVDSNNKLTGVTFRTWPNRAGRLREDLNPFELGVNIKDITVKTYQNIYNYSVMQGAGTGENVLTSTLSYGGSQTGYTKREVITPVKDVSLAATLSAYNQAYLNIFSVEQYLFDLNVYQGKNPQYGDYVLGDLVRVISNIGNPEGLLNFNSWGRVKEIIVSVDSQGAEVITPRVSIYN